jgi:hypothetical protein
MSISPHRPACKFTLLLLVPVASSCPLSPSTYPRDRRTCRQPLCCPWSTFDLPDTPHSHLISFLCSWLVADERGTHRCQTFLAYSRREYDRTAMIVTAPSECALPARGCPGRTHYPIAVSSSSSYPCASERSGRRTERCQTPGPSRSSSRNRTPRTQTSPPPSPSYYAPHIFYTAGTSFCVAKTRRTCC